MEVERLEVLKKTGSYADALIAQGLADLMVEITEQNDIDREIKLVDAGEKYLIKMNPGLKASEMEDWEPSAGYSYLKVKSDDETAPLTAIDYEQAKEVEKIYRAALKTIENPKLKGKVKEQGIELPPEPPRDLPVWKTFNSMRMGSDAYNKLYLLINVLDDFNELVVAKLASFGWPLKSASNVKEGELQKVVSPLQLFNPVSGKGVNRPKPDSTSPGSLTAKLVDWFEEWMKYRAMHHSMVSYNCGNDGKDTKAMVIAPGEIGASLVKKLRDELLGQRIWGSTSVWVEIQAAIELTRQLINHSQELHYEDGMSFEGARPNNIIKGFYSAYFKNLGTASAVMNLSFIGLPGWLPINNYQDANDWLEILAEHEKCIKSLNENKSSDVPLLQKYRDYISTGDIKEFLDFLALYAVHLMQRKAQNKWAQPFTTTNLRRLFMNETKEIIETPGFQNIATAIRKATINAQIRKSMTGKSPFEIRYGLAQNWKRKAKFKGQFIAELADFVQEYNNETARHAELGKEMRKYVTTEDLTQVIELIENDKYGSELVCMLLLAFGYALEPKEDNKGENKEEPVSIQ